MNPAQRIHGLDVARALAVCGMVYAHLTDFSFPGAQLPNGYASSLFAVLAGASVSIMANRGQNLLRRGVAIMAIGVVLMSVQTSIEVVLAAIAWIIFLLGPVARWRIRYVVMLLVGLIVIGPALSSWALSWGIYSDPLNGPYPVMAWLAYGTAGVLVHRVLIKVPWAQVVVLLAGATVVGLTYSVRYDDSVDGFAEHSFIDDYLSLYPHSGGVGDVALSIAFSGAVISVCMLACAPRVLARALYPLRATGSMALTIYVAHVVTAGWLFFGVEGPADVSDKEDEAVATAVETPTADVPWPTFQDMVAGADNHQDFSQQQDAWWEEHYGPDKFSGDRTGSGVKSRGGAPEGGERFFWLTLAGAVIYASLWKLRFAKGPMEWMVATVSRERSHKELAGGVVTSGATQQ